MARSTIAIRKRRGTAETSVGERIEGEGRGASSATSRSRRSRDLGCATCRVCRPARFRSQRGRQTLPSVCATVSSRPGRARRPRRARMGPSARQPAGAAVTAMATVRRPSDGQSKMGCQSLSRRWTSETKAPERTTSSSWSSSDSGSASCALVRMLRRAPFPFLAAWLLTFLARLLPRTPSPLAFGVDARRLRPRISSMRSSASPGSLGARCVLGVLGKSDRGSERPTDAC
jgi:hypothetical protein